MPGLIPSEPFWVENGTLPAQKYIWSTKTLNQQVRFGLGWHVIVQMDSRAWLESQIEKMDSIQTQSIC